jgi:GGDEF domain-containing protein
MSGVGDTPLISIRKSFNDLDRLDDAEKRNSLFNAVLECYTLAIDSSAHYAVEVDPALAVEFRQHLKLIEDQSRSASSIDQLRSTQASFRGELRDYRDKSGVQLKKMRQEVENATAAMMVFAETVASNGENHELEVRTKLQDLEVTAKKENIEDIRGGIGAAVAGIQSSVAQIQHGNQLVVAQLQDEIRVLHQQIEQERKALYTDHASGAWNRQKIDTHIDNLLRQNQPFCMLMVWVRNLKRLETQHSRTVVEGTLKALIARFSAIIGDEAIIGRWSQDQFVAVLDLPAARAITLSADVSAKLSGSYAVQENGQSQKVAMQATAGVIDRAPGAPIESFHRKLEQLAGAISGA